MNSVRFILVTIAVVAGLFLDTVYAGDNLSKKQIRELLSGNTVAGYFLKEGEQAGFTGQVRLKIKFYKVGRAEKTTTRATGRKSQFVEKGKWWVNEKGKLCLNWTQENKKRCGSLQKTSDGNYVLLRKKQKVFFREIMVGM